VKYSKDQLHSMATKALAARDSGDLRYTFLLLQLATAFGMSRQQVDQAIEGFIIKEERQAA
jgi:hypothetical protein